MQTKHNFAQLAEVQKDGQKTLYCAGLDPHPFGSLQKNLDIYGSAIPQKGEDRESFEESQEYYKKISSFIPNLEDKDDFIKLIASVEAYIFKVIDIIVNKCNIRVFKPQSSFYEQFGPAGLFLLMRVRNYIKNLEKKNNIRIICLLDCKRGDIFTTQAAYFRGLLGNLEDEWGISYAPYDFDIINVTPWMGSDVMVFQDKGEDALGLKLMKQGKGIIVINKTSNPSGPEYQELNSVERKKTIQMSNVEDLKKFNDQFDLEYDGLSSIGMVVGSTHICNGEIRSAFPSSTLLVPGFGAQGGKFEYIMQELIRDGKWNGLGAIFSSSRGTMYPFMEKYGGSGSVANLESDLIEAVAKFRANEKKAFESSEVQKVGIQYPF